MSKKDIKKVTKITEVDIFNLLSTSTITFLNQDFDELMRLIKLYGINQYPLDYDNNSSKSQQESEKDASDDITAALSASSPLKN